MSSLERFLYFLKNPMPPVYHDRSARLLHWTATSLVVAAFASAFLNDVPVMAHRQIGIAILAITALRFLWRSQYTMPPVARPLPRLMSATAMAVQSLLYVLLLVQPLLGWLFSNAKGKDVVLFGLVKLPRLMPTDQVFGEIGRNWHMHLAGLLAILIALHVAGAFYHHLIRRDGLLLAMLPGRKFARFDYDGPCGLLLDGGQLRVECRLLDISAGGAKLDGVAGLVAGQRGRLQIDGMVFQPAFLLIAADQQRARIGFTLDRDEERKFECALAELVSHDARVRRMVPPERAGLRRPVGS